MKEIKVSNSKVIDHAWYNPETKILSVKFVDHKKTGPTKKDLKTKGYLYVGVTTQVFNRFKQAKSKGRFFASNIRNNYPSQKNVL